MTVQLALLRAINLAGHARVAMPDLRDLFAKLEFPGARTLLQSGNVVFRSNRYSGPALERLIEEGLAEHLYLRTDAFVRTAAEWERLIADNPFPDQAERDPGHLVVMLLKVAPSARAIAAFQSSWKGPELLCAVGRQLYVHYAAGIGRSKLTNALIESRLETRGTGRNWNTVVKLAETARS